MFWRKIFFLAAWYIAGNVVNSLYSTKRKRALKSQKQEDMKLMVDDFVDTQKNLITDLENKYIPKEHTSTYDKKKKEFLDLAKKYTQKGKELLWEITEDERVNDGIASAKKTVSKAKTDGKKAASKAIKKWKLIAGKVKKEAEKLKK